MRVGWAPWRMEYIAGKKERGCVFCKRARRRKDKDLILFRGKKNFVIMNRYPYNNGHLMIVPYRHIATVEKMEAVEWNEWNSLLKKSIAVLKKTLRPQGFNIGMNVGRLAGAGIEGHLHLHVVPRWEADTNFMPVLGEVRFVPEHIEKTYQKLKKSWYSKT